MSSASGRRFCESEVETTAAHDAEQIEDRSILAPALEKRPTEARRKRQH
jgi:hypothetical protein